MSFERQTLLKATSEAMLRAIVLLTTVVTLGVVEGASQKPFPGEKRLGSGQAVQLQRRALEDVVMFEGDEEPSGPSRRLEPEVNDEQGGDSGYVDDENYASDGVPDMWDESFFWNLRRSNKGKQQKMAKFNL